MAERVKQLTSRLALSRPAAANEGDVGAADSSDVVDRGWHARVARGTQSLAVQLAAFVLALLVLVGILAALGYDAGLVFRSLWEGSVGSSISVGVSLSEAVPLILTATAFWIAVSAGVFNIGMDGQLQMGGLAALVTTLAFPEGTPPAIVILVALLAGTGAGAFWSGVAGILKTKRGTNEIISTLMLNFMAFIVVDQLMRGALQSERNRFTPQTNRVPADTQVTFDLFGVKLSWGIIIAIVVALGVVLVITKSNVGLRLRSIGLNREAARHAAVPIERYWNASFLATGAVSGLAGALVILGLRFYIAPGWAPFWGFEGVIITYLALSNPWLMPLWGILFGMLASAGPALKGAASVPDSIVTIMQTLPVIVLFVLYMLGRWLASSGVIRARRAGDDSSVPPPADVGLEPEREGGSAPRG